MQAITTLGLDIAKSVFQVHDVDAAGNVIIRRQLKRRYVLAFFEEAATVPDRHRSVRLVASLVTRTSRSCGINEIAPGIRRDVKVGRANST